MRLILFLTAGACISAAAIFMSTFSPNVYVLMVRSAFFRTILLKLSLQRSPMGSWVVSVSGWCMSPPSLLLATGSRKSAPLSPVRFVTFILDISDLPCVKTSKRSSSFIFLFRPGISTCGSGFGTIVFAPVVTHLLDWSNWQWTNRIIAGFCLLVFLSKHICHPDNFSRFQQSRTYSWIKSSPQCTFLGLTMKPVPKPKCESIDSITEMKQNNGPIIKVSRGFLNFSNLNSSEWQSFQREQGGYGVHWQ